jgi:hypothetical protein
VLLATHDQFVADHQHVETQTLSASSSLLSVKVRR